MSDNVRARLMELYGDEYRDHVSRLRAMLSGAAKSDPQEAYRHAHSLKGAARAVDIEQVTQMAHALEGLIETWWSGQHALDGPRRRLAEQALDAIEDASAAALAGKSPPDMRAVLAALAAGADDAGGREEEPREGLAETETPRMFEGSAPATVRVGSEALDRLAETVSSLSVELSRLTLVGQGLRPWSEAEQLGHALAGLENRDSRAFLSPLRAAVRDTLYDIAERDWALKGIAEALREDVRRLRMVAAESVLGGFGPMVRDMAAELGKRVRLETIGLDTLVERDVLHALAEAVLHLLRNALVHGIELPEERRGQGKPVEGHLSLRIWITGSRLSVSVGDDGHGIDIPAVRRAAAARGLVVDEMPADPGRLVFVPGLSTASGVTTGAGRGMGMSIAQAVAARLQGNVDLASVPGKGTTITITVPVAALAQRLLLVDVGGQMLAMPASAVSGLHVVPTQELFCLEGRLFAHIAGHQTPLAGLGAMLTLPGRDTASDRVCIVEINHDVSRLGLMVDAFLDVRDLPVVPFDPAVSRDERLAGSVLFEDGRLILVLTPTALAPGIAPFPDRGGRAPVKTVLVADDSPTIRTLLSNILETERYAVLLAKDGGDALSHMADAVPDAVISDIDMPEMGGFDLVAAMRADPRLRHVPVCLLSSRDGPADRSRAAALGIKAYLSKADFQPAALLNILEGLM